MNNRRPSAAVGCASLLLLGLLLPGCAGTPFGDRLGELFPAPTPDGAAEGGGTPGSTATTPPDTDPAATTPATAAPPATTSTATTPVAAPAAATDPSVAAPEPQLPPLPSATPPDSAVATQPAVPPETAAVPQPASRAEPNGNAAGDSSTPSAPDEPAPQATATNTAPYRLLLRLPAADPSAPAEAVTQALRAAGLDFVVETIERAPVAAEPQPPASP